MVVVEDVRTTLVVELRQGERAAFDAGGDLADEALEIAFVGDPDPAEVAVKPGAVGVVDDCAQGGAGQAPPLAAEMGGEAFRQAAADLRESTSSKSSSRFIPCSGSGTSQTPISGGRWWPIQMC